MSTSALSLGTIAARPFRCGMSSSCRGRARICDDVKHFVSRVRRRYLPVVTQHITLSSASSYRSHHPACGVFSVRALSLGSSASASASARSSERTVWDEAADSYFSRVGSNVNDNVGDGRSEETNRETSRSNGPRRRETSESKRRREASTNGAEFQAKASPASDSSRSDVLSDFPKGGERRGSLDDVNDKSVRYDGFRTGRSTQLRHADSGVSRNWGHLRGRSGGSSRNDEGVYNNPRRAGKWTRVESAGRVRRIGSGGESDETVELDGDYGRPSRDSYPKLRLEGQSLYGVAPISSALSVSRRKLFCLYMQESLAQNIENGKRKDKAAVLFIERTARDIGLEVRTASKHDLNLLVDNRPHQGLVLDASPLELVQIDVLDFPSQSGQNPPVWVALDEVTDPQNFGAILRSTYFLGAEGVVVCAKNSAPLSAVVSKASAGAMEVMEVHFCKNMVKFLNACQGNGWRVVGASAERASVAVSELPRGVPTILVLGNEGTGLRTNVKNTCDYLVSIGGHLRHHLRSDSVNESEKAGLDPLEDGLGGRRRSLELVTPGGSFVVDSLNVSVAAGIMLHGLLSSGQIDKNELAASEP